GLADDLLAAAAIGEDAGGIDVQHGAGGAGDADRVGDRVEQHAVALLRGLSLLHRILQGRVRRLQHRLQPGRQRLVQGAFKSSERVEVGVGMIAVTKADALAGSVHEAANAFPVLLPVSRPSRSLSQCPVAARAGRSMPVAIPIPCNIYTTSSLATLPLAPCAYGQPPVPATAESTTRTPSSRQAAILASAWP